MTRFVDLGHRLEDAVVVSGGFPTRIASTDAHQRGDADDRSPIPLAAVAGIPGLVVDACVPPRAVALQLGERAVQDRAILIRTGWDRRWDTEGYEKGAPYLALKTIEVLIRGGAVLVGVDFCSIDAPADPSRTARTRLFRAGVVVIENLCNLSALPRDGFRFFAVPLRLAGGSALPVRAFAELQPP